MSKIELICKECGKTFLKDKGEYNRRIKLGCQNFFCSQSCQAINNNRSRKAKEFITICPQCGKEFKTTTKAKAATYCSRSCASKASVNEARREAGRNSAQNNFKNLHSKEKQFNDIVHLLKKREQPRYNILQNFLTKNNIKHEFEFPLKPYIYDLLLIDIKTIIEFDEKYHAGKIKDNDIKKEEYAIRQGYKVKRIRVPTNSTIDPKVLNIIPELKVLYN